MEKGKRVEFACHTKMSELEGIDSVKEYIAEAVKRGYDSIAITDTNSVQAFMAAEEYIAYNNIKNFKIIYGTEMKFADTKNDNKFYDIYIYVKQRKGLKNLYNLVSIGYSNLVEDKPVIERKDLDKYRDGLLFAAIGNKSEVYTNIRNSNITDILKYYDFIGIEPDIDDEEINKEIVKLSNKEKKLVIATSNCRRIKKDDYICNEILNFYKKSPDIKENNNKYFYTSEELVKAFDYLENANEIVLDNTVFLSKQFENITLIPNKAHYPKVKDSERIIKERCYNKAIELYGKDFPKEIKERLDLELNSIIKNRFETIYLIYSDIISKSNELGYKTLSRGLTGDSFVAYLLGITNINPIKYNLPFEVFASKDYDKEPDIELNVSDVVIENLESYLQKRFENNKVVFSEEVETLSESTVYNCYEDYIKVYGEKFNNLNKDEIIKKLTGIKCSLTKDFFGSVRQFFIIPDEFDITDFCPIEINKNGYIKTHFDYHNIWYNSRLYKFTLIANSNLTMIHELEKATNVDSKTISLNDKDTFLLFLHSNDNTYKNSLRGIPEFGTKFIMNMLEIIKPRNLNDLVCTSCLSHGTNTWSYNAENLIKYESKKVDETISNREDLYNYLLQKGIDKCSAFDIMEFIRKGKTKRIYNKNSNKYDELKTKWDEYEKIMHEHNIPDWYISSAKKIAYIFTKAHVLECTINAFEIAWYKVHYPSAFYKVYFEIMSDLDINKYYCKRQIKEEINRLNDENERNEKNKDYDCFDNNLKINDLKILLEMYNMGIRKEKEINDEYSLINSRAIGDYCRCIHHKFNTEELAVLIFRNNRMDIKEKIEKYNDLINNYPDMEVKERINCSHYDSVKTMIKNEITRLENLYKELTEDNDNAIYTWVELNKTTNAWEYTSSIKNTKKKYTDVLEDVGSYLNEFNDTVKYQIIKKYLWEQEKIIYAEYNVVNKESKLVDIREAESDFLDIDNIFLNIPTPFKKGDILFAKNSSIKLDIFVLDYLCTWRNNLQEENCDSSDMVGYGYYMYKKDSTDFIKDYKWDYDSFEYCNIDLTGNNRILKDISSFLKGKIDLELFTHAYNIYKAENTTKLQNYYTDEALKLAGFSDLDILKENHNEEKIYNMNEDEKEEYLNTYTYVYDKIDKNDIIQLETDFYNNIYILTNKAKLFKAKLYNNKIEQIAEDIKKIFLLDGMHIYKITNENIILPIEEKEFDNVDTYLNNNNCKYKKIESSALHIVLLTNQGDVRAVNEGGCDLGIIPENFKNVDDITIVEDNDGVATPYIYKDNEFKKLYI